MDLIYSHETPYTPLDPKDLLVLQSLELVTYLTIHTDSLLAQEPSLKYPNNET